MSVIVIAILILALAILIFFVIENFRDRLSEKVMYVLKAQASDIGYFDHKYICSEDPPDFSEDWVFDNTIVCYSTLRLKPGTKVIARLGIESGKNGEINAIFRKA